MGKYILSIDTKKNHTALSKPKEDIVNILEDTGFSRVTYNSESCKVWRRLFGKIIWWYKLKNIKDGVFVFQYPIYSKYITKVILRNLRRKRIKLICVIHDIEVLRDAKKEKKAVQNEIKTLQQFDVLIVHNNKMQDWLKKNGIIKKMITLKLFDYLTNSSPHFPTMSDPIVYAGNLTKAFFLTKMSIKKSVQVYGPNPAKRYPKNVEYKGQYSSEELIPHLNGSFGLVWDGDSITENNGVYGEYTKYNNPHKVSLYLSCGLPVIVWKQAAIADFVEKNNLGISIDSLSELDECLHDISAEKYKNMLVDVNQIRQEIREGFFTLNAINRAI
ncbi:sugar transferase [Lactobacillus sp. LC28-10]|uniref:Sugar transferase n=1 Tax=Secundilactobacillus angelensis TaxID=2722706 RepID=A0ABX1KWK1_9LACO|nr:sugar transferase [Secundilactobacillus angelensis]MCH5463419.1 hypothetical protein [Secundilactobacillus angelensis]NLR18312.1 sugar transferase [Secundilactobacillus angelensis]